MLIGNYKEIVESLYIAPNNEVIVDCFIENNDYDKDENSIGMPMKGIKKEIRDFLKKLEQRKAWSKYTTDTTKELFCEH